MTQSIQYTETEGQVQSKWSSRTDPEEVALDRGPLDTPAWRDQGYRVDAERHHLQQLLPYPREEVAQWSIWKEARVEVKKANHTELVNVTRTGKVKERSQAIQNVCKTAGIIISLVLVLGQGQEKLGCDHGFLHGAVAADSETCSDIGRDILKQGGSPVDSAIAALICTSVIHPQSMGLGGGVIFTIYNASTGEVEVINARETVPSRSPHDLTKQCSSTSGLKTGVQWIGVPGELRGYKVAHQKHGRLPWKSLFEPTINLVKDGIKISTVLSKFLTPFEKLIQNHSLCELFCKDQEVLKEGQFVNFTQLGHTLRMLADKGADSFYEGPIAEKMLEDLHKQGSVLTLDDFRNYKVQIVKPLSLSLGTHTLFSPPPPAGGALLSLILNILQGYHFDKSAVQNESEQIQTYHQIIEALKFANGQRDKLRDALKSKDIQELTSSLLSNSFAEKVRKKIDNSGNHTLSFYNVSEIHPETFGTTHISVITQDGSSVSVTSSVNQIFGSMIYSPSTGIIFNNQLADFCIGNSIISIKEGQQPPSSMTPSILLSNDKNSQLVIGGAGGTRIISATVQAIMNQLWFGHSLKEAISAPVLHVTTDNILNFESSFSEAIQRGLRDRGHEIKKALYSLNVVQGASQQKGCLFAYADERKLGRAAGY
ncbi:glutathione hydrolase 5 proenzyme [Pseudophryne corroboree]|uniref:glutathione hydrolase 5 proenzyme n=1 Tax=Pseudophryne corroboree TaxID=495146 RepID=UPI003081A232